MDTTAQLLPVIRQALGSDWDLLAPAVQCHYNLHPDTPEELICRGTLHEVFHSRRAEPLIQMGRLFGALVTRQGRDVPVTVRNTTHRGSPAMHWHRTFHFPGRRPEAFVSRMEYLGPNQIVEYVRHGLGIRMAVSVEDGALVFQSQGYRWQTPLAPLHLPDLLVLGDAQIVETALSEREIGLEFAAVHPLWGRTFGYRGSFTVEAGG